MKTSTSTLLFTLSIIALVGQGQAAPILETLVFKRNDPWDSASPVRPQQNQEPSWEKRDDKWESIPTVQPQQYQEPSWENPADTEWGNPVTEP
ncbi:hypothetical protein BGX24_002795 [Mortierella sp. AD032]|nr:hypothetical protein BGX24_002795 [Mortierella sp. AD032]